MLSDAVPSAVEYSTVTVCALGSDRVTVKIASLRPLFPSTMLTSLIDREAGTVRSSRCSTRNFRGAGLRTIPFGMRRASQRGNQFGRLMRCIQLLIHEEGLGNKIKLCPLGGVMLGVNGVCGSVFSMSRSRFSQLQGRTPRRRVHWTLVFQLFAEPNVARLATDGGNDSHQFTFVWSG